MIRALIFDCFGVLYVDPINELQGMISLDKRLIFQDLRRSYDYGYVSKSEYMSQLNELTGRSVEELESLVAAHHIANDELLGYMKKCRDQYEIALLSNMGRGMIDELFTSDEKEIFDEIVVSSEVAMAKPDPAMFRLTAKRLGADVTECVMIDDSADNCSSARAVGMQSILYQDTRQCLEAMRLLGVKI